MALFDLLGRSWALGVVWQLANGPLTFREIQERSEKMSPTILNKRIKELIVSGIVQRGSHGYQLTDTGTELFELLKPLGAWSKKWAEDLAAHRSAKEIARSD
jgi:DNA-binding HxlR family transcriptional regulator